MNITFEPLSEAHFSLLLKWLQEPHVKAWWDQEIIWTPHLIEEKYTTYVKGYKIHQGETKPINAYIILLQNKPIGYIQMYNAYDFPREETLERLPQKLATFDIFIGEKAELGKGTGTNAIRYFLDSHCPPYYTHIFVDPDYKNIPAIRAYEKAGFQKIQRNISEKGVWMLKAQKSSKDIIYQLELSLLSPIVRSSIKELDKIIAEDFIEYGVSGTIYNKHDIIVFLPNEDSRKFIVEDFNIKELSPEIILATYKAIEDTTASLRSSIWQYQNDRWRIIFHQGTKIK